jgi:hypothetical protein
LFLSHVFFAILNYLLLAFLLLLPFCCCLHFSFCGVLAAAVIRAIAGTLPWLVILHSMMFSVWYHPAIAGVLLPSLESLLLLAFLLQPVSFCCLRT